MKSILGLIMIVLVIGAVLYFMNPSSDDFSAYLQTRAQSEAKSNSSVEAEKIAMAIAGKVAGGVALLYKRADHVFYSTFTLGPASKPSERYLGVAKLFIKIK